jgi:predicted phage terminase large subunit-like protein
LPHVHRLCGLAHEGRRAAVSVPLPARDSGSKVLRAQPFAAAIEAGNVSLVQGAWNEAFLDEAWAFPAGAHDDQVDAAAAWLRLSQQPVALIAI